MVVQVFQALFPTLLQLMQLVEKVVQIVGKLARTSLLEQLILGTAAMETGNLQIMVVEVMAVPEL
jgi:hypothetical protein